MPKIRDNATAVDVNANAGGVYVDVAATIPCRKATIAEDPKVGAAQGVYYKLPDDDFTAVHALEVGATLTLGNTVSHNIGEGPLIGAPVQAGLYAKAATVLAKVLSQNLATKLRVVETE